MNLEKAFTLEGWMSVVELRFLADVASKSNRVLEVGSYKGRSSRAIADNLPENAVLYCVDPWEEVYYNDDGTRCEAVRPNVMPIFLSNLEDKIAELKVIPHQMKFSEFYTTIPFDFIFIDGDHRYETVKHDIIKAERMLVAGGILAGHDYNMPGWPGVKQAVDELLTDINTIDYIWYKQL